MARIPRGVGIRMVRRASAAAIALRAALRDVGNCVVGGPLALERAAFVDAVRSGWSFPVIGEDGMAAPKVAEECLTQKL